MTRFAEGTTVSPEKTQAEIIGTLKRYGATDHLSGSAEGQALVCFRLKGQAIRLTAPLPLPADKEFQHGRRGRRSPAQVQEAHAAEVRRRWRVLLLRLKAKLEAVAEGVPVVEEFLAYLVTPTGATVYEQVAGQLQAGGPLLLTGPKGETK